MTNVWTFLPLLPRRGTCSNLGRLEGRANADRTWTECFAQLVGTVLSLWDAAELDAAGEEGEVLPKFINLTDASIKMVGSLAHSCFCPCLCFCSAPCILPAQTFGILCAMRRVRIR